MKEPQLSKEEFIQILDHIYQQEYKDSNDVFVVLQIGVLMNKFQHYEKALLYMEKAKELSERQMINDNGSREIR